MRNSLDNSNLGLLNLISELDKIPPKIKYYWLTDLLPIGLGMTLDFGFARGEDALWFKKSGLFHDVVNQTETSFANSTGLSNKKSTQWYLNSLDNIPEIIGTGKFFDTILVPSEIASLPKKVRIKKLLDLVKLMYPGSIIALLYPEFRDSTVENYEPIKVEEIAKFAEKSNLLIEREGYSFDNLNRLDYGWCHSILRLPNPNNTKVLFDYIESERMHATYKLALLRVLYQIAQESRTQGDNEKLWIDNGGNEICVPAGLVGLYWVRMYKPLLEQNLPQRPKRFDLHDPVFFNEPFKNLIMSGKMSLEINTKFDGKVAENLVGAIVDSLKAIRKNPLSYNCMQLCRVTYLRTPKSLDSITLNRDFFTEFGEIYVPKYVWNALCASDVSLDNKIITEWCKLMYNFSEAAGDLEHFTRLIYWYD